jgi:MOSC domain-containing protein YiiM
MYIVSTNIAEPKTFLWRGKQVTTGIYKKPTGTFIFLNTEVVKNDEVSDRKVHGGEFKACYLFAEDHYPYWKVRYPHLDWTFGMFGENLTVNGLDEKQIFVGDIYKVGKALIQVTQPREPCFKLGAKFGSQKVLKEFIEHSHPGTYVRVLEKGTVAVEDHFNLVERDENAISTYALYRLIFAKEKDQELLKKVIANEALPIGKRVKLSAYIIK